MITNLKDLCHILEEERNGKKVVLATGTFDLFHYSHLSYLEHAKEQGDILVVAVKNDKCAHLKGENRPIIDELQRVAIIDALKCVDYVILVDYDPSVIPEVKADNSRQEEWLIIFQDVFKELHPDILFHEINPLLEDARERVFERYHIKGVSIERGNITSTSKIIEKIKNDK